MRPLSALVVALIVVIGTVPVGVAAAASGDAPTADAVTRGIAQVQDNETATPTNGSTETATPTANDSAEESTADNDSANDSTADIEPGAQLAGVVAVQGTEVSEEVGSRAFGLRVAAAATNESKATVVAAELNDTRERLEELRDRRAELERAREAGEISDGRYRAEIAGMSAEINAIERRLNQTTETAASLPASVREKQGINTSNIQRLRTEAGNLSGPETAAIARGIAGANAGSGLGPAARAPGQSGDVPGRSGGPGNVTDGGPGATNASAGAAGERGGDNARNNGGENPGGQNASRPAGSGNSTGPGNGGAGSGDGSGDSGNGNAGAGNGPNAPGNSGDGAGDENARDSD